MTGPAGWADPLHARALDAAGVGPGTRLLDAGCGTGAFAAAAAARGAVVHGIDTDPVAVDLARAAVPGAMFAVGDAARAGGAHDVAAAIQLLPHVGDPQAVLRALGRAAPTVVATVWGREDECGVRAFGEALEPFLGPRPPLPALDAERLHGLVAGAGLTVAVLEEVVVPFTYTDVDDVLSPVFATGMGRAAMRAAGPVAVRDAVLERMARHARPDGSYVLDNLFRVLVAQRPS